MRVLMRVSVGMRVFVRMGYAVVRMLVRMNVRMKGAHVCGCVRDCLP